MSVLQTRCPACGSQIRRTVAEPGEYDLKCPDCGHIFIAETDEDDHPSRDQTRYRPRGAGRSNVPAVAGAVTGVLVLVGVVVGLALVFGGKADKPAARDEATAKAQGDPVPRPNRAPNPPKKEPESAFKADPAEPNPLAPGGPPARPPGGTGAPPKKLTPGEREGLKAKLDELTNTGLKALQTGNFPVAAEALEGAVDGARRLYPKSDFPDGHADLAAHLMNLASLHHVTGKSAAALEFNKEALDMLKRFHKGDHPAVALCLRHHASISRDLGKTADAEGFYQEALAMLKRLHDGDHPDTALLLNDLAVLYQAEGKLDAALALYKEALDQFKRLFKGDHPDVALATHNLGAAYQDLHMLAAAEPLLKDAVAMRRRLFGGPHSDVARSLVRLGLVYRDLGKLTDADSLLREALAIRKRLVKGDDPDVANGLSNLAEVHLRLGRPADAEPLYREALAVYKRLYPGDHLRVAIALNGLAAGYRAQGKLADAESLFKESVAMVRRLAGDHPGVAAGLNNLAMVYQAQGKWADAAAHCEEALAMRRRLAKGDGPEVAQSLTNLGQLYQALGRLADAERLLKDSLAMYKRLYTGDHPGIAACLSNLAVLYTDRGDPGAAEPFAKEALAADRRMYRGDHPDVAWGISSLAAVYGAQEKWEDAGAHYRDALAMYKRLTVQYARQRSEGDALTLFAAQPAIRDALLSLPRARGADSPAIDPTYSAVWDTKGEITRAYEARQAQARAASVDPALAARAAGLADARRRRAELLLAPTTTDPATLVRREEDLKELDRTIAKQNEALARLLPAVARVDKLDAATVADLQQALAAETAVVDYVSYWHNEGGRGGERPKHTRRYSAFVVTRGAVVRVDLGDAAPVVAAVDAWRGAITSGKEIPEAIPEAIPARVRELVWEKVRQELPAGTRAVYLCPDATLCRVPFAALPGDEPGTVLLENFALATIPHAPFLLDKLWPQDPVEGRQGALVVGGVKYDAEPAPLAPGAAAGRGAPLVKSDAKLAWAALPATLGEADGVATMAERKKIAPTRIGGERATPAAVLAALPKARYAHFATHGFFADASFRGLFQLDEKDYARRGGERIGRAVNSPLVMTGLVFAGANDPKAPGRGILTGEQLIDLDLSGLDLAVLSACETGLGDVSGGEGTFGLQRAFHCAGTKNVVASLWKVPDQSTAALMNLFYRNLWEKDLPPIEALRQAQLELYRNPQKIPELAKGFRGKFEEVAGAGGEAEIKPVGGKAHPLLWAAFTLSGPGR